MIAGKKKSHADLSDSHVHSDRSVGIHIWNREKDCARRQSLGKPGSEEFYQRRPVFLGNMRLSPLERVLLSQRRSKLPHRFIAVLLRNLPDDRIHGKHGRTRAVLRHCNPDFPGKKRGKYKENQQNSKNAFLHASIFTQIARLLNSFQTEPFRLSFST